MAGTSLDYDANGNLVSDGTTSYTYDAENRLVMTSYGGGTTLLYDPLGRLYGFGGTASKSSVYDGDQRIVDYTANPAVIQQRYVMGPGSDNPLVWYYGSDLTTRYALQADERGSIVSVVDGSGTTWLNSYDEYGIPAASNTGRYGYTGQLWVPQLGLWYYKARFYSAILGRFMQTDPIGYDDGPNWYAYVGNDPIDRKDPSGNQSLQAIKTACAEMPQVCAIAIVGGAYVGAVIIQTAMLDPSRKLHINSASSIPPPRTQSNTAAITAEEELTRRRECRKECVDRYVEDPESLPGSGRQYDARLRRCIRECIDQAQRDGERKRNERREHEKPIRDQRDRRKDL